MIPFSKLYYTVFELPCKFRRHVWYGQNIVVQSRTGRRTFPNLIYKGRRPLATDSEKWRDTVQTFWRCCMLIDTYWYIYIYIFTHTHSISLKIFCSWCKGGLFGDEACQASCIMASQAKPAAVFHRRGGFVPCLVEADGMHGEIHRQIMKKPMGRRYDMSPQSLANGKVLVWHYAIWMLMWHLSGICLKKNWAV